MSRFESFNNENPLHSMRNLKAFSQKSEVTPVMPKPTRRAKNSALVDLSHIFKNEVNEISSRPLKKDNEMKSDVISKSSKEITDQTNAIYEPTEVLRDIQREIKDMNLNEYSILPFEQISDTEESTGSDRAVDSEIILEDSQFDDSGLPEPEMFSSQMGFNHEECFYAAESSYYEYMKPEEFPYPDSDDNISLISYVDFEELSLSFGLIPSISMD